MKLSKLFASHEVEPVLARVFIILQATHWLPQRDMAWQRWLRTSEFALVDNCTGMFMMTKHFEPQRQLRLLKPSDFNFLKPISGFQSCSWCMEDEKNPAAMLISLGREC